MVVLEYDGHEYVLGDGTVLKHVVMNRARLDTVTSSQEQYVLFDIVSAVAPAIRMAIPTSTVLELVYSLLSDYMLATTGCG